MSKELADRLEESKYQGHTDHALLDEAISALRSEPVAEIELSGGVLGVNFTDIDWKLKATDGTKLYAAPSPVQSAWTPHGVKREEVCVWVQDSDGPWNTSCGKVFEFTNEGPAENEANFCYHCGGALLPEPYSDAAPSRETAKPEGAQPGEHPDKKNLPLVNQYGKPVAEPALSAEQITPEEIAVWMADGGPSERMHAWQFRQIVGRMALSSITALDEKGEAEALLKKLVDRLHAVHADPLYHSVWALHQIRNGAYTGPQYAKELAECDAYLSRGQG